MDNPDMPVRIVGTIVEFEANFRNSLGELANPTEVHAEIRLPDDSIVDLDSVVSNPSVGKYVVPFLVELNGLHQFRVSGEGTIEVADEGYFIGQTVFPET